MSNDNLGKKKQRIFSSGAGIGNEYTPGAARFFISYSLSIFHNFPNLLIASLIMKNKKS